MISKHYFGSSWNIEIKLDEKNTKSESLLNNEKELIHIHESWIRGKVYEAMNGASDYPPCNGKESNIIETDGFNLFLLTSRLWYYSIKKTVMWMPLLRNRIKYGLVECYFIWNMQLISVEWITFLRIFSMLFRKHTIFIATEIMLRSQYYFACYGIFGYCSFNEKNIWSYLI